MSPPLTRQSRIALASVCLSCLMFGLEISSVPAILPTLEKTFHASFRELQWIMNAYTIAVSTVLMATGTLADRYGRKRVFLVALAAFGLASLACGISRDVAQLIAARALQGASGGAMLICQIAVLSHAFQEPKERAFSFGLWGVVFGLGLGFGPVIGGATVAFAGWQWVFLVHLFVAALAWNLALAAVRESRDREAGRVDWPGIVTLSLCVFCVAFYITQGRELGYLSREGLGVLALAALSFAAFLAAERFSKRPMFDFAVFRIRPFTGAIAGSVAMNFSFWPFMIYLPIWFHAGLGYDSLSAGLALLGYTLPTLVLPPLAERLSLRYGAGRVIPAGLFGIGTGFVLMKLGTLSSAGWVSMLPGCVIAGVGLGLANTPVTNTTTGSVSSDRAGMASGIDISARMVSLAINIAVMGFLIASGVRERLAAAAPDPEAARQADKLAELIAAGALDSTRLASPDAVHAALAQGFGWAMLYAAVAAWLLAGASFVVFNVRRRS